MLPMVPNPAKEPSARQCLGIAVHKQSSVRVRILLSVGCGAQVRSETKTHVPSHLTARVFQRKKDRFLF